MTEPKKKKVRRPSRRSDKYIEFRNIVRKRDNFTCQICLKKRGDQTVIKGRLKKLAIVVHHIIGFIRHIEGRHDPDNAVTLCTTCHSAFHSRYGNKDVNQFQFYEWSSELCDVPISSLEQLLQMNKEIIYKRLNGGKNDN